MRIMFTSFPGLGHLHPLMSLALAARDAGHEIRVASGADLVEWARRTGVDAHAVGPTEAQAAQLAERDFAGPDAPRTCSQTYGFRRRSRTSSR